MSLLFIWKCPCGYVELWEEFDDIQEDSRRYFTRECPKCTAMMSRQEPLRENIFKEKES